MGTYYNMGRLLQWRIIKTHSNAERALIRKGALNRIIAVIYGDNDLVMYVMMMMMMFDQK